MNDVPDDHPSPEHLSAFSLGKLEDDASAAVAAHLATCATCCDSLETVRDDPFVARLRSSVGQVSNLPIGRQVRNLPHVLGGNEAPTRAGDSPPEPLATELPAELAGHPRYRVLQVLGTGGMGTVYKAEHRMMDRPVALKVLRAEWTRDADAVERFRREVKAAARLAHPNIVHAYDAEQTGGTHFLVMEFVAGQSLDRVVAAEGSLPVARACDYVRQAALGLQHAFERGMVHRDVKPQNLMRTPDGTIKILDFGLARFAREAAPAPGPPAAARDAENGSLTQTGSLMGTPDYMAPEQAGNPHEADIRADIYSLGCTLYFLLAGQAPFPGHTGLDKIMAHIERMPEPVTRLRPDVPVGLACVLERMLAKDPARRYQTPAEVARALEPFTHPAEAPAPQEAPAAQPPRRGRRLRVLLGGLGGAAVLAGLVLLGQGDTDRARDRMNDVFDLCAVVGGTLLACQFLLALLGLGHHGADSGGEASHDFGGHDHGGDQHGAHDADHESQVSWFTGLLTFRTVVAALLFFGLAGRTADAAEVDPTTALGVGLAAGAGALFLVAWAMRSLYRLRADGTVRIERSVGRSGTVYLPIPANRGGAGKVLLNVQNRTVEYQAVTAHQSLPTGAPVTVLAVVNADTVEVALADTTERIHHV
jgi:serine/threonine protein kinase